MAEGLRENDPNREILDSEKSDRTPGFLGGTGGGDRPAGFGGGDSAKAKKASNAKGVFGDSEAGAAGQGMDGQSDEGFYRGDGGVAGAKKNEESGGGLYNAAAAKGGGKKKGKGNLLGKISGKKKGLLFGLILSIFGIGGIMSLTNLSQPFSLVAQFRETFNTMHPSAQVRADRFFRYQMDTGRTKNPIKGKVFGSDTFKISEKQAAKLAVQGIEYDDEFEYKYNGKTMTARVLKYIDDAGDMKIITADAKVAKNIGDDAVDFKTYYADNDGFFGKFNAGSQTWRGAIANWFGSKTNQFLQDNKLTRNMTDGFKDKVAESGGDSKVAMQKMLSQRTDEIEGGGFRSKEGIEEKTGETGEDGEAAYSESDSKNIVLDQENPGGDKYKTSGTEVEMETGNIARKTVDVKAKLDKISGGVQKGANIACTIGNVIGAVTLMVTAAEALQIVNLTTAYFETIDKTKAGEGDDTPIHDMMNALNEKKETKNYTLEDNGYQGNRDSTDNITEGGIKSLNSKEHIETKSAMQSSGIGALYGNSKVDTEDPSVQSFNFTNNINRILGGVGVSMAGFETCAVAKMVTNGISAAIDAVEIIACIAGAVGAVFTFGATAVAGCSALALKALKGIAISVAIGIAVSAVISTITPLVTNALTRDLVSDIGGEDLGNALASGGNMYLGSTHRANGGSLATEAKYVAFLEEQQKVIADNARYERVTHSPFDVTSKYTFMGSIMTQLMSFLTTSSLMDVVTTSSSTVSSSLLALSPTTSAYDIAENLPDQEEYKETCPYLESIGAVGDAYCNPYIITDYSTSDMDPADVEDYLYYKNSFLEQETSDGNVQINGSSDLAKYINYCDGRESPFGIADNNIISSVSSWGNVNTDSSTFNTVTNSAIGAIPVVGDIIDIGSNAQALANVGYVSGESCVAGNEVENAAGVDSSAGNSPQWSDAMYYQRFIEDQSLAESMGLIEESAVTAYLNKYYEEHPLDNSYEGILARKSGLSKDTVVAVLDLVEYGEYIANYDPSERYTFGAPAVEKDDTLLFDNDNTVAADAVLLNVISFADVRNRSFAA